MDKVQKIREEVAKRYNYWREKELNSHSIESETRMSECQHLLLMIDSLQEESVSEDFEEALAAEWKGYNDRGAATFDALEDNTQELAFAKGFYRGANWKEQKDSIVSDDLEEAANNAVISLIPSFGQKNSDGSYVSSYRDCFKREEFINLFIDGAKWQKQKDDGEIKMVRELLADFDKHCDEYHEAGFKHGQEALMKDAVDVEVKVDTGGYPYIPQMELYDYDKDVPLAKAGDRYKVILIKEG